MKSIVPIVMAGVLGIYGLIISVIISTGSAPAPPPTLPQAAAKRKQALCVLCRLSCAARVFG